MIIALRMWASIQSLHAYNAAGSISQNKKIEKVMPMNEPTNHPSSRLSQHARSSDISCALQEKMSSAGGHAVQDDSFPRQLLCNCEQPGSSFARTSSSETNASPTQSNRKAQQSTLAGSLSQMMPELTQPCRSFRMNSRLPFEISTPTFNEDPSVSVVESSHCCHPSAWAVQLRTAHCSCVGQSKDACSSRLEL